MSGEKEACGLWEGTFEKLKKWREKGGREGRREYNGAFFIRPQQKKQTGGGLKGRNEPPTSSEKTCREEKEEQNLPRRPKKRASANRYGRGGDKSPATIGKRGGLSGRLSPAY